MQAIAQIMISCFSPPTRKGNRLCCTTCFNEASFLWEMAANRNNGYFSGQADFKGFIKMPFISPFLFYSDMPKKTNTYLSYFTCHVAILKTELLSTH